MHSGGLDVVAWLTQIVAVSALNLRSLHQRAASSAVAIVGIAGVVIVFVAVLSIAEGFRKVLVSAGSDDTAIVMRAGSDTEMTSGLALEETRIVKDAPGVRRNDAGAVASAELLVLVDLDKKGAGTPANVPMRGVQPAAFAVRDEVRLVEGRLFEPGRSEVIAGRAAAGQFEGLEVGRTLRWGEAAWTVVGIFEANGTVAESELWADAGVVQPAYRRGNSFQAVYAKLESPAAFETFKNALTADPRLEVKVQRETAYYEAQSQQLSRLIETLGYLIAVLMGIGAVFGAVNTMYTAVASRAREIATLRALGFGAGAVVCSVLTEAMILALVGGTIGGLLAWVGFNGYQTATLNWQTFTQTAFAFAVTPALLVQGLTSALVMGLLGGLLPALRAARLPVVTALREL
jgi:putative ABC transport system permease protein